jgi:hypothetical protein
MIDLATIARVATHPDGRFTELVKVAKLEVSSDLRGLNLNRIAIEADEDISGYDFSGCLMQGAILRGVDLREARFESTDLTGADLRGARIEEGQLETATTLNTLRGEWNGSEGESAPLEPIRLGARAIRDLLASHSPRGHPELSTPLHPRTVSSRIAMARGIADRIRSDRGDSMIVGPKGMGKTAIAHEIKEQLDKICPLEAASGRKRFVKEYESYVVNFRNSTLQPGAALMSCLLESEYSTFLESHPEIFFGEHRLTEIIRRYDPPLAGAIEDEAVVWNHTDVLERLVEALSDDDKIRLFTDILRACRDHQRSETEFIFFIDDVDRLERFSELIDVTQHIDEAIFVFLLDSQSGFRLDEVESRYKGGIFLIEPLTISDLSETIDLIPCLEGFEKVTFSTDFVDALFKYSKGYPQLVNTLLSEAVYSGMHFHGTSGAVPVGCEELESGVARISSRLEAEGLSVLRQDLKEMGPTATIMLDVLDRSTLPISERDLISSMETLHGIPKKDVEEVLVKLIDDGFLRRILGRIVPSNPLFNLMLLRETAN